MKSISAPFEAEIQLSIAYLASEQGLRDVQRDAYWPKWNSPWWHMLLLHEMGETKRIPEVAIHKFVEKLDQMPVKIFPLHPSEIPSGTDPISGTPCHCQTGNVYQVLTGWGLDVDKKLPWIKKSLIRSQMSDGGLNCDEGAYLVKDEVPSSMVGMIAGFEAFLMGSPDKWTPEERKFIDQGAKFLMGRKLKYGSSTKHNSEEQISAKEKWPLLCFPRFYFYDVLRGLNALLLWSDKTQTPLDPLTIQEVVTDLSKRFADGSVVVGRQSFAGTATRAQDATGKWVKEPASFFPLLDSVSRVGEVSPFLSKQWRECQVRLAKLNLLQEVE